MNSVRRLLCWLFAISSLICLRIALSSILHIIHQPHRSLSFRILLVTEVFSVLATVFGMAWFTIWRGKASGKWWGIAASLTNVLFPLSLIVGETRPLHSLARWVSDFWHEQDVQSGEGVRSSCPR